MTRLPMPERFWTKVDASAGEDDCWPWIAARDEKGYGWFQISGTMRRAHTIAYRLTHGEPPDGHIVRHTCDNKPCCNPRHLISGTKKDNSRDAVERNRLGPRHGPHNSRAYLTEEIILACRARYVPQTRKNGVAAMARELGVNEETLRSAVTGRSWSHLS